MGKAKPDFKRMLLRLPHSASDYAAVKLIAELADVLGADLIGSFVEDLDLRALVDLPDAREFRAGAWHRIDSSQLARDFTSASHEAERLFLQMAGLSRSSFRVVESASAAAREAGEDDIIVVIEPKSAVERATRQFGELLEIANRSTSSILWIPSLARRVTGPIVVMASEPEDPCISAAVSIAASVKEKVILLPAKPHFESFSEVLQRARAAGVMTSLVDAVFHDDDLLLPPHIKAGLLVAGRERAMRRRNLLDVPTLFVSANRPSTASGTTQKRPGTS
ncbi:MAG: hypothetical protein AB7I42_04675 [Bradyrhizobium sp.]|uniref:hypothetical protein n=1 Tax=Bradyrhizobium sp. TaxID=376 RepID=UPI00354712EA